MTLEEQQHYMKLTDYYEKRRLIDKIISDLKSSRYGTLINGIDAAIEVLNKYKEDLQEGIKYEEGQILRHN